ncbi:epoxide hydrolase family protein [Amycolatopsis sp. WQ 127309]|uniref:epoxide hydrolase family protein n=1 Tax=Amycolatopsis sp. WQ 127309 TaxID=2932773 RepID=UPI001FF4288A|nr:epoxide hydrolase family protein [Amycolatopsis sp. WQ 127309]UOZ05476.1 epoxide hydrolase [Amycolatopsis sp. WQ 127309]
MQITPFSLAVPESQLADLRERLRLTRWPEPETVSDTSQGPRLAKIRALCEHWSGGYDWRRCEDLLNGFGQFHTEIDGVDIHFLHVRSPEPDALPLIMTHGWPGSVLEFRKVIGPLTDPAAHGGDPRAAFHLVVPTMPGFGFSGRTTEPGWTLARTAGAWITLMDRLGYDRWGAQGGDLGAGVTDEIGRKAPAGCVGLHLNFAMFFPTPQERAEATPHEQAMLDSADYFWETLSGYAKEQSTRPQTIGYSLADSPAGQAAWIYAMFQDTCGTPGDAEASFTHDELLDDIMLYWLPNAGSSAAKTYWEMARARAAASGPPAPITIPTGFTMAPHEHVRKSRRWIERRYTDLVHFAELDQGGHFLALEQPDLFVAEVRASFATLR